MKVGSILTREQAERLPVGSQVRRVDGPKAPYRTMTKRSDGLWAAPKGKPTGLGTADWEYRGEYNAPDVCCTANQHCKAPSNVTPRRTVRSSCYACGNSVCTAKGCSVLTTAYPHAKGKRVRICADCAEDYEALKRRIEADIYEGFGMRPIW